MAGLCEGGNEPPGSLKATIAILYKRASQSDRTFQLEGITDAVLDSLVINPADENSDDSDLEGITPLSLSD
ncbi:hypothetical protein ANN_03429 [Periplaneta americana]|uniref:Uncharacterized protein n=1 Tax=Periplaneta americana TaxID=6978 RepID=A0ABQ8TZ32_PERAM|nr:hypothetical protein ANN_03429 [Periplaneta americana]